MAFEHPIVWTDEKVARLWDYYSRTPPYSEVYFSKLFGDQILKASRLPLGRDLSVLDFGCGPGFIWDHLRRLNAQWKYTGLDFSPTSVQHLRVKAADHDQFRGAHHVTALPSDLPSAAFDCVLLFEVVEHLKDEHLAGMLTEVARVLRPGGTLVVTTPNDEDLALATRFCPDCGAVYHEWQHIRTWSVSSLDRTVQPYGFQLQRYRTLDFTAKGSLRGRLRQLARLLEGRPAPHMVAVFGRK